MISKIDERELWTRAQPYLERGRPGDVEHTQTVLELGKRLLEHEGGEPLIVIPTLILHDVGWSQVDFWDFLRAPAEGKIDVENVRLHMVYGARIASEILTELGFDRELIERIAAIIAVHDIPHEIQALDDLSATLVFEADWLDKYSPIRRERYSRLINDQKAAEELREWLEVNKPEWFRTKTAWDILETLSKDSD